MLNKIKKFTTLDTSDQKLFIEAYILLGVIRFAILMVSFKRLVTSLEHSQHQTVSVILTEKEFFIAQTVGRAINRAANHTPWESACLAQALVAQRMLQKRGIPGVFYLGAMKDKELKGKINAHAWSKCGDTIITGGKGHEAFTVLSVFGWEKQ